MDYKTTYQDILKKNIQLSGIDHAFFAEYHAQKIGMWYAHLHNRPLSILDFGCSDGVMTSFLPHIFPHAQVHGVDNSQEHIEVARMAYTNISFATIDNKTELPFADNTFDLVIAAHVFHHIRLEQYKYNLQELSRVLKPTGMFILFELNPYNRTSRTTFKRNHVCKNAEMIHPWRMKKLLTKNHYHTSLKFINFFHQSSARTHNLEKHLSWLPFGGMYAILGTLEA